MSEHEYTERDLANHHKLFWTGGDIETSASSALIWDVVIKAIGQTKGKFTLTSDEALQRTWSIKGSESLFATAPELTFEVQISDESDGRHAVRTRIVKALLKESSIPFGPKHMMGHKAFMKVSQTLGLLLTQVDPTTSVRLREGPMPEGFSVEAMAVRVAPPPAKA